MPNDAAKPGYIGRVAIALAGVVLAVALAELREIVVLVFGSIVVAVAARSGVGPLRPLLHSDRLALAVVVLATATTLALGIGWLGKPIAEGFTELQRALPAALEVLTRWLDGHPLGRWLLGWWSGADAAVPWTRVAGLAGTAAGAFGSALLMVIVGLYLAADPGLYRRGVQHLLPRAARPRVDAALGTAGRGLQRWLFAQAIAMLAVGSLTAIGLALIGMPLAMPLGIVAGLLEFVPFFGTLVSSALILLLALAGDPSLVLPAVIVCVVVQQLEGYVLQPLLQRWAVALPPALGLVAVVVFGALFGPLGIVFAMPLVVVLMLIVQCLCVPGARAP
jgi:predicted PurR-regulated permease PerM